MFQLLRFVWELVDSADMPFKASQGRSTKQRLVDALEPSVAALLSSMVCHASVNGSRTDFL